MTRDEQVVRIWMGIGLFCAGAIVLGAFLPWMALTNTSGTTEAAGFETLAVNTHSGTVHGEQHFRSDGFIYMIEATIVGALLALTWFGYKRIFFHSLSILLTALILGFSIYNVVDISALLGDLESSGVATGRIREGLWLTVAAAASLQAAIAGALAGTVIQRRGRRRAEAVVSEVAETPDGGGPDDEPPSVPIGGASG